MTIENMKQKTEQLRAKTRSALLRGLTVPLLVAVIAVYFMAKIQDSPSLRVLFALAFVWSLAGQYFLHSGVRTATRPGDAAPNTGLESYRREVQRQRYLFSSFLLWTLGPAALALATFTVPLLSIAAGKGMLVAVIPFLTLMTIWLVSVFVIRMRDQRELQREIDNLDALERADKPQ